MLLEPGKHYRESKEWSKSPQQVCSAGVEHEVGPYPDPLIITISGHRSPPSNTTSCPSLQALPAHSDRYYAPGINAPWDSPQTTTDRSWCITPPACGTCVLPWLRSLVGWTAIVSSGNRLSNPPFIGCLPFLLPLFHSLTSSFLTSQIIYTNNHYLLLNLEKKEKWRKKKQDKEIGEFMLSHSFNLYTVSIKTHMHIKITLIILACIKMHPSFPLVL